jgi:hypothetical protein
MKAMVKRVKAAGVEPRKQCVGCGQQTERICPQCGKPTCGKATGLCGHVEGICAACVEGRLLDLVRWQ